ncbi:MAG: hypothetical protein JJE10_04225 [Thermoleophilia bacterium]|nr:hypothetical protein [Thermoleophilia bacterium]
MTSSKDQAQKISELLHEVGETHHAVYRITDGTDPDWASFYSNWLVTLSELPELLDEKPVRSELTALLVEADRDYTREDPDERWEDYYARRLLAELGSG